MDAAGIRDWGEVKALVLESYGLIAPRKTLAKMQGSKGKKGPRRKARRL